MFKTKHVFTCPDVIYLRNRQKKINRISLAVNGTFVLGMIVGGKILEAREMRKLESETEVNPTETQE